MEGVIGESMRMKRRWRLHLGVSFSEVFFSPCSFACRWLVRPWHVFSPFPLRGKGLCIDLVSRSLILVHLVSFLYCFSALDLCCVVQVDR